MPRVAFFLSVYSGYTAKSVLEEYSITFTSLLEEAYRLKAKESLRELANLTFDHLPKADKQKYLDDLLYKSGEDLSDDTIEVDNAESLIKLKNIFGQK